MNQNTRVFDGVTYVAETFVAETDEDLVDCVGCAFDKHGRCILASNTLCTSKVREDKRNIIWVKATQSSPASLFPVAEVVNWGHVEFYPAIYPQRGDILYTEDGFR